MKRLVGVLFCLILVGSVLLPLGTFGADSGKGPSSDDWFIPYQRLPEDIKVILEEEASPEALELIQAGDYPREELIQDWLGREEFEGDVYPVYHSEGAVYVFRGSGEVRFPDGGGTGVVLSGDDRVAVGEVWSAQASEAMIGKREPPSVDPNPSSSNRTYAGLVTLSVNNRYFGVRANVNFPQFVDTTFNIYTTHVVFTDDEWFESYVGQYVYSGVPTANFWVSWDSPTWTHYNMEPSSGSPKNARLQTRYFLLGSMGAPDVAFMWIYDLDTGDKYTRYEVYDGATTDRVDLVQEQITSAPVLTEEATFQPTYIFKGGYNYVDWTSSSGPAVMLEDDPMQLDWISSWTYDFRTWCEGE
jgi:hypothetical protein